MSCHNWKFKKVTNENYRYNRKKSLAYECVPISKKSKISLFFVKFNFVNELNPIIAREGRHKITNIFVSINLVRKVIKTSYCTFLGSNAIVI